MLSEVGCEITAGEFFSHWVLVSGFNSLWPCVKHKLSLLIDDKGDFHGVMSRGLG